MAELAVIVPTLNESRNIRPLTDRLTAVLDGIDWEVVFVDDDSPDGTAGEVRALARENPRVHVVHRIGRRGLSSACIEGMLASTAPFLAVMDGDMQHDETILPRMFELARSGQADIVIGSRNVEGGSMGEFDAKRVWLSNMGRRLSNAIAGHVVSDPMSGYFLLSRPLLEATVRRVSGVGFKILLDLIASSPSDIRIAEVPYTFRNRQFGESKLNIMVGFEYLVLLLDKSVGYTVPVGFALFALVGSLGVGVHFATLSLLYSSGITSFLRAQAAATFVAMVFNFFLNNSITHRSHRLIGAWSITRGLILFLIACSLGAVANLAVARLLLNYQAPWAAAALAGVIVGSVWNYSVTSVLTWHLGQRRARRAAEKVIVDYRTAANRVSTN